jgi:S-methylmethionine-dependent homocysteine/selenocysteine methylase
MTDLLKHIAPYKYVLSEGAVVERLRREYHIKLHPRLEHAMLIYSEEGRSALQNIYHDYMDIAARAHTPIVLATPTWRANRERVIQGGAPASINQDSAEFVRGLFRNGALHYVLGLMSCRNDCYKPNEALSREEARKFHAWQIKSLVEGGVACILATTLPEVEEACGMALAMQDAGAPGIISFVIDRNSIILDGTTIAEAINRIDAACETPPLGYMLNCSYPSFLKGDDLSPDSLQRILGFGGNASSLNHSELDNAECMHSDSVADWGNHMLELHRKYGIKILGGCCGTDSRHLNYIVDNI